MNDFKTGSGQDVQRGRGPWPKDNSLSSVTAWLINRLGATDEQDRELMSVSRLMLDSVSGMERGERLSRRWQAGESQLEVLSILADRWNSGQPLQHMLNEAHFMGLKLLSDGRALIPRPETEELVHAMMDLSSSFGTNTRRVLDVGTGSGASIGVLVRQPTFNKLAQQAILAVATRALVKLSRCIHEILGNGLGW